MLLREMEYRLNVFRRLTATCFDKYAGRVIPPSTASFLSVKRIPFTSLLPAIAAGNHKRSLMVAVGAAQLLEHLPLAQGFTHSAGSRRRHDACCRWSNHLEQKSVAPPSAFHEVGGIQEQAAYCRAQARQQLVSAKEFFSSAANRVLSSSSLRRCERQCGLTSPASVKASLLSLFLDHLFLENWNKPNLRGTVVIIKAQQGNEGNSAHVDESPTVKSWVRQGNPEVRTRGDARGIRTEAGLRQDKTGDGTQIGGGEALSPKRLEGVEGEGTDEYADVKRILHQREVQKKRVGWSRERIPYRGGDRRPRWRLVKTNVCIEDPFEELNLRGIQRQVGGIRVRQHVNPLKASLQVQVEPPKWEETFRNPCLPLVVDIGSGSGRFVMVLAKRNKGRVNYLGLEIREKLVDRSRQWALELGLDNTHFMLANATFSLDGILASYPGKLSMVTILCPDPHFKKRHHKRRVVQKPLVETIAKWMEKGGRVFVQSDVQEVAIHMKAQLEMYGGDSLCLAPEHQDLQNCDGDGWLMMNPLGVPTERETYVLSQGGRMYRSLYIRR
ncbi:hypothetical protein CBR_g38752 [Chara braunii]|uniref:tRNA (guanine(46)-N(7))-methyltransferase n=1 Tax=Chara braunii TaxID=69332 RepID=A0A388LQ58_CHABU|nr:hypothetical protein CBR_g38752 [Chara braunii]|eukprot:GBG84468.1 hypothetical protein CBR_g38752 [Chara braunii]